MSENATLSPLTEALTQARELIGQRNFGAACELLMKARKELFEGAQPAEKEELFYCMGVAYNGMERAVEAIAHLTRALTIAEQTQDPTGMARNLEELGSAHHQKGEFKQAEHYFERALKVYQKTESKPGIARNMRNLGGTRVDLGNAQAALANFKEARVLFSELGDSEGVATCVVNMTLLTLRYQGRPATIEEYKKHLADGDCKHFLVYNNLGFLLLMEEQLEDARKYIELGIKDCEEKGVSDDNVGLLYLNLGLLSALEAKLDEADDLLHKASIVFTNYPVGRAVELVLLPAVAHTEHQLGRFFMTEDGHKLAVTFLNTAVVAHMRGDNDLALELAQKSVEFDKEQGYPYAVLGWIHKVRGEDNAAATAFKRAVTKEPKNELFKKSMDLINPYLGTKVGRNDACPCGSGKKFKKCHGTV